MYHLTDAEEEILENLWVVVKEKNERPIIERLEKEDGFSNLIEKGLLDKEKDFLLTKAGEHEAMLCVRRHRLAEKLLVDILNVSGDDVHEAGCKFEHGLHNGIEDNICTLLGHPRTCPHGKQIPLGECCKNFDKTTGRLIMPLVDLSPGDFGKISYINTADQETLKKLIAMGMVPGNPIKLLHRFPSFVFELGGSNFAIDKELAGNIFVLLLKGKE